MQLASGSDTEFQACLGRLCRRLAALGSRTVETAFGLLDARKEGAVNSADFVAQVVGIRGIGEIQARDLHNQLDSDKDGMIVANDLRTAIQKNPSCLNAPVGTEAWAIDLFNRIRDAIDAMPGGGVPSVIAAASTPLRDSFTKMLIGSQATIDEARLRAFLRQFDTGLSDFQAQHIWHLLQKDETGQLAFDDFADMFCTITPLIRSTDDSEGEQILERIRAAIAQSEHPAPAVFRKLTCGTGRLFRRGFEQFILSFEPGLAADVLAMLWRLAEKNGTNAITQVDFERLFQAPAAAVADDWVDDWVEHTEPGTGKTFYYSAKRNESSWTKPAPISAPAPALPVPAVARPLTTPPISAASSSTAGAPAVTPSDWVEHEDPATRRKYYYNSVERRSTWNDPRPKPAAPSGTPAVTPVAAVPVAARPAASASDWVEQEDPATKRKYYYNSVERRSTWNDPRPKPAAPPGTPAVTPVAAVPVAARPAAAASDWVEHEDPATRRKYYYNSVERRSTWNDPRPKPAAPAVVVATAYAAAPVAAPAGCR